MENGRQREFGKQKATKTKTGTHGKVANIFCRRASRLLNDGQHCSLMRLIIVVVVVVLSHVYQFHV